MSGTTPLCIGATATYSSSGDAGGSWSSSNTSVATVNASSGLVTAVTAGTANIIYTVSTGCNSPFSASKSLTISPNASAGTVSGTTTLCIDATATYTSSGDAGESWSSSNTAVATVNASTGLVSAVSAGTADIIYTVNSGCNNPVSSSQLLIVNPNANAGTVSGTSPLCNGATNTYTSDGDAGGSWSSTNLSVATVDATTGLVTAVGSGTTNIIYTISSGCNNPVSSFSTLTVNGCFVILNLSVFIDGFYIGGRRMIPTVDPVNYPNVCDTVIIELHENSSPYSKAFEIKSILYVDGTLSAIFPFDILNHSYYIVLRHRNTIETWSKNPVLFNSQTVYFDFTQ